MLIANLKGLWNYGNNKKRVVTRVLGRHMINVRRAMEVFPDAVSDENGDDAEAELLGVLENQGADAPERPARAASFDTNIKAVFGYLLAQKAS